MGLVTVFWPVTTTGSGETAAQTGETRFVVDCKVKPVVLVRNVSVSWRSTTHYSYGIRLHPHRINFWEQGKGPLQTVKWPAVR